jgi:hypothetical protein
VPAGVRLAALLLALGGPRLAAQAPAPELASLVRPLPIAWEQCKARAAAVLRAEGYTGLLESGNGWIARSRRGGTAVSITCVGRNRESVLVLVTAGTELVREATRLFELISADSAETPVPPAPESRAAAPERSGWSATGLGLAGTAGTRFNFWCPPNGRAHPVVGDGIYSAESSVCSAAVHAGSLTLGAGGNAIVELAPGRDSYSSATRNGITSLTGGRSPASFLVIR